MERSLVIERIGDQNTHLQCLRNEIYYFSYCTQFGVVERT